MKRLFIYLGPYKKESILAPLFKLLEAFFDLLVPLVVADIINTGVAAESRGVILRDVGILILLAAVGLACSVTAQYFAAKAAVGFASRLRQAVFDHVLGLGYTELDRLGTGTLITRLTSDINQTQTGLNMGLRLLLRSPFIVFGSMIMAFAIDVKCALIFAVAIPILAAVVFGIMIVSIPLFARVQRALDGVTTLTRENLTGVRVIRAFCKEREAVEDFDARNEALTKINEFVGRISALLNPATYVLINLATILLIRRGALQVDAGRLLQGDVVALYNYMAQMIVELVKLASLIITINKALACAGRVSDVLGVTPKMQWAAETKPAEGTAAAEGSRNESSAADAAQKNVQAPRVRFENVSFTYADAGAPSLSNIDFSAPVGSTIGIIGGTGAGKSTLVSLIPRFYDATEGRVLIDGKDIREIPRGELTRRIGVVPQKAVLFAGTIRDNLRWGKEEATDEELMAAAETAQAAEVIAGKEDGLSSVLEPNGRNLSGGQRQRLTIARALVGRPEILILDDSASVLDFATDARLRAALARMEGQATIFIVSQRASSIMHADRILVLGDGELAGSGTHEELMQTCDVYREIYYSQFPEERPKTPTPGAAAGREVPA